MHDKQIEELKEDNSTTEDRVNALTSQRDELSSRLQACSDAL